MSAVTLSQGANAPNPLQESAKELTLVDRLNKKIGETHAKLSETSFGKKKSGGTLSEGEYVMYLADLYCIYSQLESELENKYSAFYYQNYQDLGLPVLFRKDALESDMNFFNAPFRASGKATTEYAEHLKRIAIQNPCRLIAHVWVRYLGDLARRDRIVDLYQNKWPQGMSFYHYGNESSDELKKSLTEKLNALKFDAWEIEDLEEEAEWALNKHQEIYEELSSPSPQRRVYAFAIPYLLKYNPLKLIPDRMKVW